MQELNELKNLVIQSLEANGSLSNIRAQIRASVFKVVDQQESSAQKKPSLYSWENQKCQRLLNNENGPLVLQLIKEFLQFYSMDYSNSVFSSESNQKEEVKRDKINASLTLIEVDEEKPLLLSLIEQYKAQKKFTYEPAVAEIRSVTTLAAPAAVVLADSRRPADKVEKSRVTEVNSAATISDSKNKVQLAAPSPKLPSYLSEQKAIPQGKPLPLVNSIHDQQYEYEDEDEDKYAEESHDTESGKKALEDAEKIIKQNHALMKNGQIASLPMNTHNPSASSVKYNQAGYNQNEEYGDEEHDEGVEEQLGEYDIDMEYEEEQVRMRRQAASGYSESEDFIGQSSKGQDVSVDSYQLEDFDYVTDVEEA